MNLSANLSLRYRNLRSVIIYSAEGVENDPHKIIFWLHQ